MNGWPSPEPLEASTITQKIKILKERCWEIIQYGLANRSSQPPASYVVQFALTVHSAFEEVENNSQQMSQQATDHLREAQIRLEQTTKSLIAAAATSTNRAEDGAQEASAGSVKTPRVSIPSMWPTGVEEPSESDLQIRLRWEDRTTSPYRKTPPNVILKAVNRILEETDNPSLDIQIAAVRKLKSGDLDLYTYNVAEKERLLENSGDWLAQLEQGQAVRVMGRQYAILAHSVPFEFYPKSREMAEAKEEVLKSNPGRFPSAEILYLGWVKGFKDKACKKSSSSLVIAFGNPRHANQAILEGIFLRGALIRTELYDPGCRVVQCSKCYQFGHVAAMCPSTAACPFCTLAHGKKQCPIRKNPTRYKCTVCKGPHAANDRQQCPEWIEQSTLLGKVKQRKARLFPVPPNTISPAPNSAQSQSELARASDPGEALSGTGAAPPVQAQVYDNSEETAREQLTASSASRDPLDDSLPSFGRNDKPRTIRQHFRERIIAQRPKESQRTRNGVLTANNSMPNLADPPSRSEQGGKGQMSQPTSSSSRWTPTPLPLPLPLPSAKPDTVPPAESYTSSEATLQQAISESPRQVTSRSNGPGTRKRPHEEEPTARGQEKRLRPSPDKDRGTPDEIESGAESVERVFSRTPSKRIVKTTSAFIEAQSVLRKTLPLPKPKRKRKRSKFCARSDPKDGQLDAA